MSTPCYRETLLAMAQERGPNATLCPSEVARRCAGDRWRDAMPEVQATAQALWAEGKIEVLQRGRHVNPAEVAGPIRIRIGRLRTAVN